MHNLSHKLQIQKHFNNASCHYDQHCVLQKFTATACLQLLPKHTTHYAYIADLACGTGISTEQLTKSVGYDRCYAVDFSEKLLLLAREKHFKKHVSFVLSDYDNLNILPHKIHFIFCNMGFQWSLNFSHTLKKVNSYLYKDGILLFSMPILGTFQEMRPKYRNQFHPMSFILNTLTQQNFCIDAYQIRTYQFDFDSPLDALKSIKKIGANYLIHQQKKKPKGLTRNHLAYAFFNPSAITLNYNIMFVLARKRLLS